VSDFVEGLLAASPIPVVMVRRGFEARGESDLEIRSVLVPAIASPPGRAAQEVAFGIARRLGAPVLLAHVVTTPAAADEIAFSRRAWRRDPGGADAEPGPVSWAHQVLEAAEDFARELGVEAETAVRIGVSAPRELLALAREAGADLIVLPASLRQLSERPFLGYGVEYLLQNSESTVVVVSLPAGWRP
jgi:nucleotide-binding universal stress UspA family protein